MARIRITNSPLAGHKALSLESTGKTEGIRRMEVLTQAQATLRNMQSIAVTATPEELFVNFMYDSVAAGMTHVVANGRMFEGMRNLLTVQAGRGSHRGAQPLIPGVMPFTEFLDANIIAPTHSSATPEGRYQGVVSASSEFDQSNYGAWRAVNSASNGFEWQTDGSPLPAWLKYDFRLPVYVQQYGIQSGDNPTYLPKSWQFQGSMDGTSWTTLDTQSNITDWASAPSKKFMIGGWAMPTPAFYRYFRLFITESNDPTYVNVTELRFYSALSIGGFGSPTLWTPFTDTVSASQFRVGCIVPTEESAPRFFGVAAVDGNGAHVWTISGVPTLRDTRAAGKAYVAGVSLGQAVADHPVNVYSPRSSYYSVCCLAAERIP